MVFGIGSIGFGSVGTTSATEPEREREHLEEEVVVELFSKRFYPPTRLFVG